MVIRILVHTDKRPVLFGIARAYAQSISPILAAAASIGNHYCCCSCYRCRCCCICRKPHRTFPAKIVLRLESELRGRHRHDESVCKVTAVCQHPLNLFARVRPVLALFLSRGHLVLCLMICRPHETSSILMGFSLLVPYRG